MMTRDLHRIYLEIERIKAVIDLNLFFLWYGSCFFFMAILITVFGIYSVFGKDHSTHYRQ